MQWAPFLGCDNQKQISFCHSFCSFFFLLGNYMYVIVFLIEKKIKYFWIKIRIKVDKITHFIQSWPLFTVRIGILKESPRNPRGTLGESSGNPRRILGDSSGFLGDSSGIPWVSLGIPQGFLRDSSGIPQGFLRDSSGIPQGFLRDSLGTPLRVFKGFLKALLKGFFRDSSLGTP